jgi:hypothetical protein
MIEMLKRHEIQVLRRAGHSLPDVAKLAGVSVRSVQRVDAEPAVAHVDGEAERERRRIGRPSKAEPMRGFVVSLLAKEPKLLSLEVLRRARLEGYDGGKSALTSWSIPSVCRFSAPLTRAFSEGLTRHLGRVTTFYLP